MATLQFKSTPQKAQKSFYDPDVLLAQRPFPAESFYVRFRLICDTLLPDVLFAALYTGFGRPPISPSLLMRLLLLLQHLQCSDAMAMENLLYDERWRYLCHLPLSDCTIHSTTLHYFRLRLLFGTIDRTQIAELKAQGILVRDSPLQQIFEAIKHAAVEWGILDPEKAQYIDSTSILGAAAVQDTFTMLFHGLRQVITAHGHSATVDLHQALLQALHRTDYTTDCAKPAIDWHSAEARQALLTELVQDSALLLSLGAVGGASDLRDALTQLARLVSQDVEVTPAGQASLRQGVAKHRQCSVVDADMRHGRKSSSRRFNGYKAHLAVEPTSGLITAVVTTEGSVYDGAATEEILTQTHPTVLGGDHAYDGPDEAARALEAGTAILTPTPALTPFAKDAFALDEDMKTMTCPNGITANVGNHGQVSFPAKGCRNCPHQAECNPSGKGRKLTISRQELLLRQLRAAARSGHWDEFLRLRCLVEHSIYRFLQWAGRKGRYWGKLKTGLQMLLGESGITWIGLGSTVSPKRPRWE